MSDDRPVGESVEWAAVARPARPTLQGEHVLVRPLLAAEDAESLYGVSHPPSGDPAVWTYLPHGPYARAEAMRAALDAQEASEDPMFFSIVPVAVGTACGFASYLRITPEFGVIEVGYIMLGAPLQRTTAATEAIYLFLRHAFDDLGYRRFEWKCDALNAPSRRAALRFGFAFEGVFRQHMVIKGRNRDTAWFAIIDRDWPGVKAAFEAWLSPENFDSDGRQRRRLEDLRRSVT
jgi:RimJ/RimL family protein N-acetyltransferase